tara:strand:+ start:283 stop:486 length:204 start_codon:yes stop_codon:yes gene_type:complete
MLQIREECGSYSEKTEIDMSTDMSTEINMSTERDTSTKSKEMRPPISTLKELQEKDIRYLLILAGIL